MNVHSFLITLPYKIYKMELSKSELKINALVKATISLVNNHGFHAAPMSKIAKMAEVSPGTIYLYFTNKQDLINKVYLGVKKSFTKHAFKYYNTSMTVEEGFKSIWFQIADFKLNMVEEAMFLSQSDNTPMVDEESRQEGIKHLLPLLELWERGQEENVIKKTSPYLLYAYTIYPLAFLMNAQQREEIKIEEEDINSAYAMAWHSIKE